MAILSRLDEADRRAFEATAAARLPGLERVLPGLSHVAGRSVLWFGTAAALAATRRATLRRAALRGVLAIGVASPLVNVVGKRLFGRPRPSVLGVPPVRMRHRVPVSPAFPSGHSASAAAFATGVALEAPPRVAVPVAVVAAAVAFSRVYVGAHYPGDVLAGSAIGVLAGSATRLVWPGRPGAARPARLLPVERWRAGRPGRTQEGEGVVAVVNTRSGPFPAPLSPPVSAEIRAALPLAEVVEPAPGDDLDAVLAAAAGRATVLAAAGGDGTVRAAAAAALEHGVPLLVIPAGTLNHFARTLGMEVPGDALAAFREGALGRVDVGLAGGRPFLNTASVGVYSELVARRSRLERRLGRWPALAVAAVQVIRRGEPARVRVGRRHRDLWLAFAGNGAYGSWGTAPTWRRRLDDGVLDVRLITTGRRLRRLRAVAAILGLTPEYLRSARAGLLVASADGRPLLPSADGEVLPGATEVRFAKAGERLMVFVPARPPGRGPGRGPSRARPARRR